MGGRPPGPAKDRTRGIRSREGCPRALSPPPGLRVDKGTRVRVGTMSRYEWEKRRRRSLEDLRGEAKRPRDTAGRRQETGTQLAEKEAEHRQRRCRDRDAQLAEKGQAQGTEGNQTPSSSLGEESQRPLRVVAGGGGTSVANPQGGPWTTVVATVPLGEL